MVSPYTIDIPDERLATIMAKVDAYDWSQLPDAGGWRSGVGIGDLKRLVAYWRNRYDWRAVERRLNQLPHFLTDVDGVPLGSGTGGRQIATAAGRRARCAQQATTRGRTAAPPGTGSRHAYGPP